MRLSGNNVPGLVSDLARIESRQADISKAMSSGSRLTSLGTDAAAAGQAALQASAVRTADSYVQVANSATSRMQAADSILGTVVGALTSGISLAVQGSSATLSESNRQALALQVNALRDQVLTLGNSSYQGSYLFAGTRGDTVPFAVAGDGSVSYQGDSNSTIVTTESGARIETSIDGQQAFGAGGSGDVFQALNQISSQLSSGLVVSSDAISNLRGSLEGVLTARSALGANMSRLNNISQIYTASKVAATTDLATLVSADPADLATKLSAGETQRSALMSTIAIVQKGSLFDYL